MHIARFPVIKMGLMYDACYDPETGDILNIKFYRVDYDGILKQFEVLSEFRELIYLEVGVFIKKNLICKS
jgi:hypothetical protein